MKSKLIITLLWSLLSVIGIYLLCTPIFYFYSFTNSSPIIFIVANVIRVILIVLVGVFLSRKNNIELKSSRRLSIIFCALSGLSILLSFAGIPQKLYGTLAATLDIYDKLSNNLGSVILIEQLLNNHLITSFLICSTLIFFKPFDKQIRKKQFSSVL